MILVRAIFKARCKKHIGKDMGLLVTRRFTTADFQLKLCKALKVQPLKRNKGFPSANALASFWVSKIVIDSEIWI